MGQILGFSHCQEYGSVASTPDSTPPCTDGGNEESELYELQTARDWSEDETAGFDDDDTLASSPSIWGTPRQSSLELTFSYIAIAEPEAVGASRTHRERRRGGSRGSRTSLVRTDTPETPLESPDVDWDPQGFLTRADVEEERVDTRTTSPRRRRRLNETVTMQPSSQTVDVETQGADAGVINEESRLIQAIAQPQILPAASASLPIPEPESPIVSEEPLRPTEPESMSLDAVISDTQEKLLSQCLYSAFNPSDSATVCPQQEVMDLIYWKDTERTGMVLTGLVVGLLCLFQLSIITVISTVSLAIVCFTISVRIYYNILHSLKWGDGEHPFQSYLDMDISFSGEQAELQIQKMIIMTLCAVDSLKRLFFVSNLFESLKLLFLIYLVTYLGDLCNGLTLLIIGVIALFSVPLFYRRRQEQVDSFIAKIQALIDNVKDFFRRLAHGGSPPPDPTPGGAKPKIQ
ncbi:reticulon-2a isoform X1 [Corythoichthys intestinalis]|uniref:reticulon-2a isoform X1 n=1 Tax=Corythoichthys intestinalis TaxID=161448 RepID=UPI0025A67E43|nr:reticulon-2a isoform X1 [Corythoichthys intestinalis]